MTHALPPDPFVVVGENVHASRTCARRGASMTVIDGEECLRFEDAAGSARTCPIALPIAQSTEFAHHRVKHIKNALLLGLAGDGVLPAARVGLARAGAADDARAYLVVSALRQQRVGARFVDLNVDDVDEDLGVRCAAMAWLVRLLEHALEVPLALDSSSPEVLDAGLRASRSPRGPLLLNSASIERPEVLDLAAELGAHVVLSAVRHGGAAPGVRERLDCVEVLLGAARARGMEPSACFVDMLVLPAGLDRDAGAAFLAASRAFRAVHGADVHVIGGLSNISFGLPNRRLLNDTFVALAIDAGVDSGILDPLAIQVDRVRSLDRHSTRFRLAAAVVLGTDAFGTAYLAAHRAGALAEPPGVGAPAGASL
jgi:5-methyltetrahydrofolate--homocysteine methyltransferase